MHFSWSCLWVNIMSTVLLPGLKPHCASGRVCFKDCDESVKDDSRKDLSCNWEAGNAPVVLAVQLTSLFLIEGDYQGIAEVIWHHLLLPDSKQGIVESHKGIRACCLVDFSRDVIFPDALLEIFWWITLLISSVVGVFASETWTGCWGIWFRVSESADEGRFSRVLKCPHQRLLRPSWSLMSVFLSDDSSGVLPKAEGPKTVFSTLKNFLALWVSA